jgi:hypothetical protein
MSGRRDVASIGVAAILKVRIWGAHAETIVAGLVLFVART